MSGFTNEQFHKYVSNNIPDYSCSQLKAQVGFQMWKLLLLSDIESNKNGYTSKSLPFDRDYKNTQEELDEWCNEHVHNLFGNVQTSDEAFKECHLDEYENKGVANIIRMMQLRNEMAGDMCTCKTCEKSIPAGSKCCGTYIFE